LTKKLTCFVEVKNFCSKFKQQELNDLSRYFFVTLLNAGTTIISVNDLGKLFYKKCLFFPSRNKPENEFKNGCFKAENGRFQVRKHTFLTLKPVFLALN